MVLTKKIQFCSNSSYGPVRRMGCSTIQSSRLLCPQGPDEVGDNIREKEKPSDCWLVHPNKCPLLKWIPLRHPSETVKKASEISSYRSVSKEARSGISLPSFLQYRAEDRSMGCVLSWPVSQLLYHSLVIEMKRNEGYIWNQFCDVKLVLLVHKVWSLAGQQQQQYHLGPC